MAKTAKKDIKVATMGKGTGICPKDGKTMVATKVVRHRERSGMFWVCECGYMKPVR